LKTLSSQQKIKEINGQNRTWFAGAWMQNGFHEDGYSSAINVATKLMNLSREDLTV
jgi:predicted NAD/FAD-binding protein